MIINGKLQHSLFNPKPICRFRNRSRLDQFQSYLRIQSISPKPVRWVRTNHGSIRSNQFLKPSEACSAAEKILHGSRRTAALTASALLHPHDPRQRRGSNRGLRRKPAASARPLLSIIATLGSIGVQLAYSLNARRRPAHQFVSDIELHQQKKPSSIFQLPKLSMVNSIPRHHGGLYIRLYRNFRIAISTDFFPRIKLTVWKSKLVLEFITTAFKFILTQKYRVLRSGSNTAHLATK